MKVFCGESVEYQCAVLQMVVRLDEEIVVR